MVENEQSHYNEYSDTVSNDQNVAISHGNGNKNEQKG
jgi:hypothetical protein